MKWLFIELGQNSDATKVDWRPARSGLVLWVFAPMPNTQPPPPDTPSDVNLFSKLCLKLIVNVVDQNTLLGRKPNNHSLVVLDPPG
jgi:hypothetical protein